MPRDHAVADLEIREPGSKGKFSRLDGAGSALVGDAGCQQFGRQPLEELPVPAGAHLTSR